MKKFLLQIALFLLGGAWFAESRAAWDVTSNPYPITKPEGIENGGYYYFRNVCSSDAALKVLGADFSYEAAEVSGKHVFKAVFGDTNPLTGTPFVYFQNVESGKWFSGTNSGWTIDNMEESVPLTLGRASETTSLEWLNLDGNYTVSEWIAQGGDEALDDAEIFPNEGKTPVWKWRTAQWNEEDGDAITLGMYQDDYTTGDVEKILFIRHIWGWDSYPSCSCTTGGTGTNPWYAYKAVYVNDPIGDLESLVNQYKNEDLQYMYRGGTDPGCIDQKLVDNFFSLYQKVQDTLTIENFDKLTDEIAQKLLDNLKAARQAMDDAEVVPMREGYFYIPNGYWLFEKNQSYTVLKADGTTERVGKTKAMYDVASSSGIPRWSNFYVERKNGDGATVALDLPRDRYYMFRITKVNGGDDLWHIQNVKTGRYLNDGSSPTTQQPENNLEITYNGSGVFVMRPEGGGSYDYIHAQSHSSGAGSSGALTSWSIGLPSASTWKFYEITDAALLDSIKNELNQNVLEAYLKNTLETATDKYQEGFKPYLTSETQLASNAVDPSEGSLAELLDRDTATFFHSSYHSDVSPAEHHYLQTTLPRAVDKVGISWYKRIQNNDNRPTKITVMGSNDGRSWSEAAVLPAEGDTLPWGGVTPEYKGEVTFNAAYKFLRFVVTETTTGKGYKRSAATPDSTSGMNGGYPFFTFSEFQLYEGLNADGTFRYQSSSMAYREDMKPAYAALETAIALAQAKVGQATQSDIDALQAAIDAFDAVYPDTTLLDAAIERAETYYAEASLNMGNNALGTYNDEAVHAALKTAVEQARDGYDKATVTRAEIDRRTADVNKAIDAFLADINMPVADTWYFIVSRYNGTDREEDAIPTDQCIYAGGKSIGNGIKWGGTVYETGNYDPVYLWRFLVLTDTTYAVQNLGTGYYLGASRGTSEQYQLSDTVVPFKIAYIAGEQLSLQDASLSDDDRYRFIHADAGHDIVTWSGVKDSPSAWTFQEVSADEFYIQRSLPMNGMDVFCFPYVTAASGSVTDVNYTSLPVYTLAGAVRNGAGEVTELTLNPMDIPAGGIPAGTPYILVTPDEDQTGDGQVIVDFSIDLNGTVSTETSPVNGMVGLLTTKTASAGCGYFRGDDHELTVITGTTSISSQSGYIDPRLITEDIPATEGSITVKIAGDGVLNQIKDAIREANALVTVTTIDGLTIRRGVKASEALKGLPAGIYIVGGKKISVK